MKKSLVNLLCVAAGWTLSAAVFAVGMGGINVTSGLGQQLKAEIELVAVSNAEKASLVARLATPDAYKGAGLDYPYGNKFKFQIESRANGEPYLKVSSAQPINDPFMVVLVELTWSSGKLLREYTFLLDPPGYVVEIPAQAKVQAVPPTVQADNAPIEITLAPSAPVEEAPPVEQPVGGEPPVESPAPLEPDAPSTAPSVSEPEPEPTPVSEPDATEVIPQQETPAAVVAQSATDAATASESTEVSDIVEPNEEWVGVLRGDSLSKISSRYKPAEVSLERMLVAMYRANANVFDGKNMNRIRAGKILRLPSQQEIDAVKQSEAVKEVRAQTANWNAYRQKLASAAPASSATQAAEQVVAGKVTSSVADQAPVSKESAKEVLKLSKGTAPGDQVAPSAGSKAMTAQDKKNAAQEDAIAAAKTEKEGKARAVILEKNLQDMKRLAQLKTEAAALAQPPVHAASSVAAASAVKPVPAKAAQPVHEEPALADQVFGVVEQVLDEPIYLAGVVGVLLALGGLVWFVGRRKTPPAFEVISKFTDQADSRAGQITTPPVSSPDTGDFTRKVTAHDEAAEASQDVDPISEADLFLNFGRDAQAEEILKDALKNTPENHSIHLKLLGIYASRKDLHSFAAIVTKLQESGDADAIRQALEMGRELEPNNPNYGGTGSGVNSAVQSAAFDAEPKFAKGDPSLTKAPAIDFDLGGGAENPPPSPEDDFFAEAAKTVSMTTATMKTKSAGGMDFDITSTPEVAEQEPSKLPDLGDLIFDVTGSRPASRQDEDAPKPKVDNMTFDVSGQQPKIQEPPAKTASGDDSMMEFTLDFPVAEKSPQPASATPSAAMGFADISLNLDDAPASSKPSSDTKDEHWQEVATKLDLAKAYQEMGDASGAREILEEVLREGDDEQRATAQSLLDQLG